jgi:ferrous-iron efflux pump FieF
MTPDWEWIMNSLRVAALISACLAVAKGGAFMWSGSIVVLASFLDSLVDTFLSFLNFKISKWSREQPDPEHPYGHGGFEVMTSLLQGTLIAGSGVVVIFQALDRSFAPKSIEDISIERLPIALMVMAVSTIVAMGISFLLGRAKAQIHSDNRRNLSVEADHAHYAGDVWQNLFVITGLILAWMLKNPWVDVVAGFFAGLVLLWTAYPVLKHSVRDVMNADYDPKLRQRVESIVADCNIPEVKGMHRLRTRSLGPNRFVDFHLKLPNNIPLIEAHEISYRIESVLKESIPGVDVLMHLDPESEPDE